MLQKEAWHKAAFHPQRLESRNWWLSPVPQQQSWPQTLLKSLGYPRGLGPLSGAVGAACSRGWGLWNLCQRIAEQLPGDFPLKCDTASYRRRAVSQCCIIAAHCANGRTSYNSRKGSHVGVKPNIGMAKKPCQLASLSPSWAHRSWLLFELLKLPSRLIKPTHGPGWLGQEGVLSLWHVGGEAGPQRGCHQPEFIGAQHRYFGPVRHIPRTCWEDQMPPLLSLQILTLSDTTNTVMY